jgi:thiamine kinase-like enzyme
VSECCQLLKCPYDMTHLRMLCNAMQRNGQSETTSVYQYAGPNPVAFDIANHWCEYGADYHTDLPHLLDYSRMPSPHQQVSAICLSSWQLVRARPGLHALLYVLRRCCTSYHCKALHAQQPPICESITSLGIFPQILRLFWQWR